MEQKVEDWYLRISAIQDDIMLVSEDARELDLDIPTHVLVALDRMEENVEEALGPWFEWIDREV